MWIVESFHVMVWANTQNRQLEKGNNSLRVTTCFLSEQIELTNQVWQKYQKKALHVALCWWPNLSHLEDSAIARGSVSCPYKKVLVGAQHTLHKHHSPPHWWKTAIKYQRNPAIPWYLHQKTMRSTTKSMYIHHFSWCPWISNAGSSGVQAWARAPDPGKPCDPSRSWGGGALCVGLRCFWAWNAGETFGKPLWTSAIACLVGGLVAICYIFPYIGLLIIPIDFHIFQRGGPTTNQMFF